MLLSLLYLEATTHLKHPWPHLTIQNPPRRNPSGLTFKGRIFSRKCPNFSRDGELRPKGKSFPNGRPPRQACQGKPVSPQYPPNAGPISVSISCSSSGFPPILTSSILVLGRLALRFFPSAFGRALPPSSWLILCVWTFLTRGC